jgi:hypothetical protein
MQNYETSGAVIHQAQLFFKLIIITVINITVLTEQAIATTLLYSSGHSVTPLLICMLITVSFMRNHLCCSYCRMLLIADT